MIEDLFADGQMTLFFSSSPSQAPSNQLNEVRTKCHKPYTIRRRTNKKSYIKASDSKVIEGEKEKQDNIFYNANRVSEIAIDHLRIVKIKLHY